MSPAGLPWFAQPRYWLVVVSLLVLVLTLQIIIPRISSPYPIDMWESATMETAVRLAHGEPYYANMGKPGGILPSLYTPGQIYVVSWFVPFFGPSYAIDRIINLAAGLTVLAIAVLVIWRRLSWSTRFAGGVLLVAANTELGGIWTGPRADAVPFCLGFLTLCAMQTALSRNRWAFVLLGALLLELAFWWKQTAIIFAVVPVVYVALDTVLRRAPRRWIMAIVPGAILFAAILAAAALIPHLVDANFKGPGHMRIQPGILRAFAFSVTYSLCFYWLILVWNAVASTHAPWDATKKWAVAVIIVGVLPAFLAAAKVGGAGNSFLYCVHALIFICVPMLDRMVAWAENPATPLRASLPVMGLIGVNFIQLPTFLITPYLPADTGGPYGDAGYATVMRVGKTLSGSIVSPQDPMIAYRLTGFTGTPLVNEWDYSNLWPLPHVMEEIQGARYVITYGTTNAVRRWPFEPGYEFLRQEGFAPLQIPRLENSQYQIWSRPGSGSAPANPAPVPATSGSP